MKRKSNIPSDAPIRIICGIILAALILVLGAIGGDLGYGHKANPTAKNALSAATMTAYHQYK